MIKISLIQNIYKFFVLGIQLSLAAFFVSCDAGIENTAEFRSPALFQCQVSIQQDGANIDSALRSQCDWLFASDRRNDGMQWNMANGVNCDWLSLDGSKTFSGAPNDDEVGRCDFKLEKRNSSTGPVEDDLDITVFVANTPPVLSEIDETSILQSAGMEVIRTDAQVESTDEGYGTYSVSTDHLEEDVDHCADYGNLIVDANTGEVGFDPDGVYFGYCFVGVVFDDENSQRNVDRTSFRLLVIRDNINPDISSSCDENIGELENYLCQPTFTDPTVSDEEWSFDTDHDCAWLSIDEATGEITGTPDRSDIGTCQLSFRIWDGYNFSDSEVYNVSVNNVTPVVTAPDNVNVSEDAASAVIIAGDDVSSSDDGYGSYFIDSSPGDDCADVTGEVIDGSYNITNTTSSISIDPTTGEVTFEPPEHFDTNCVIRLSFNDGEAIDNIGFKDVTVQMNNLIDDAPVIWVDDLECSTTINQDEDYTCTPNIWDPDTGDTHEWTFVSNTCSNWADIDDVTGVVTGRPDDNQVGSCSYEIKATGNQDSLDSNQVTAAIDVDNLQPDLSIDDYAYNSSNDRVEIYQNDDSALVVNVESSDEGDDYAGNPMGEFSFIEPVQTPKCSDNTESLSIDNLNGEITLKPTYMFAGECYLAVQFDDQNTTSGNNVGEIEFEVYVIDENVPNILEVTSTTADGTYYLDDVIDITVRFDEKVIVDYDVATEQGPRLFLETGAIDRFAEYIGQGGANNEELNFRYTVQEDDVSPDLAVHSTVTYLELRDATLEDRFGNSLSQYPMPVSPDPDSLSEQHALIIDGTVPDLTITGEPSVVSPDVELDITVDGSNVVDYRYKINPSADSGASCDDATGYSTDVPLATHITDTLYDVASGTTLKLCILGVSSDGNVTPLTSAFEYVWTKDSRSIEEVDFSAVTDLPNWQEAHVDSDNPNRIYAKNLMGDVFFSDDYGENWDEQCSIEPTFDSRLMISPGPDRTAYIFQDSTGYRVESLEGAPCPMLFDPDVLGTTRTEYKVVTVSFSNSGTLYVRIYEPDGTKAIYRSFDQGQSWSLFHDFGSASGTLSFAVNPTNPDNFVYELSGRPVRPEHGVYYTTDGGDSFTKARSIFYENYHLDYKWHPDGTTVFNGDGGIGYKSTDGGATWIEDRGNVTTGDDRFNRNWHIEKRTGYGYRLSISGSNIILELSENIKDPAGASWSTIHTFTNYSGSPDRSLKVSAAAKESPGNPADPDADATIVVNIENNLFISQDGGATFTERFSPEYLKLATIASAGNNAVYGATYDWGVVRSVNNGEDWEYKTIDYNHCLGKQPRMVINELNPENLLMYTENYEVIDCNNLSYTNDQFETLIERDELSMSETPRLLLAKSPHDPKRYYMAGDPEDYDFRFHRTENSAEETTLRFHPDAFTDPTTDAFIHPDDINKVWMIDAAIGSGTFYEYDTFAGTRQSFTTGLTSLAALDVYPSDSGKFNLRVMDREGRLRVSDDNGQTFSDQGVTSGVLPTCSKRFLYHHTQDRNLLVTGCVQGDTVALSKDNGSTWDTFDLQAQYGISCDLRGLGLSATKIFVACDDSTTFSFNYVYLNYLNGAADSVLTGDEITTGDPIVEHRFPNQYELIEYAIIPSGDTCDGTTTGFSTTPPTASDFDATVDARQGFQICVKQQEKADTPGTGDIYYMTSSEIFIDTTTPTFTSIALANSVSDTVLKYEDRFKNENLVDSLVGTDFDFAKYALVEATQTCDATQSYDFVTPKTNSNDIFGSGNYKVCVELSTLTGLKDYGESLSFQFDPEILTAQIDNLPESYVTFEEDLNIDVSGTNITEYKYKVTAMDDCADPAGYSSAIPVATNITDNISGQPLDTKISVCVVGSDGSGNWQPFERYSSKKLIRASALEIDKTDFSSIANLTSWSQVEISPEDDSFMYALNTLGEVFHSTDAGDSWQLMCRVSAYRRDMVLHISNWIDGTAYVVDSYITSFPRREIYRVDGVSGRSCPQIDDDLRGEMDSMLDHSPITTNNVGDLYIVENQYDKVNVRVSKDNGRTWSLQGQLEEAGLEANIAISPHNPEVILVSTKANNSSNGIRGLYRSVDRGETFNFVTSTGFTNQTQIIFDPNVAGNVYTNRGYYSTDNGETWIADSALDTPGETFAIDNLGNGYRLKLTASDELILERSAPMSARTFSDYYSFGTQAGALNEGEADVSAVGSTIAVVFGQKLFISKDSGLSFSEVLWPGRTLELSGLDSNDGETIYSLTKSWNILGTSDSGEGWSEVANFITRNERCDATGRLSINPVDNNSVTGFSSRCERIMFSTSDGFQSVFNIQDLGTQYLDGGDGSLLISPVDPSKQLVFNGNGQGYFTDDYFATVSGVGQMPRGMFFSKGSSLISDPNKFLGVLGGSALQELRSDEQTVVNLNSRYTLVDDAAAIGFVTDSSYTKLQHRIMSTTGEMIETNDDARTFTSYSTNRALTECDNWSLNISTHNDEMMVAACIEEDRFAYTLDGGGNWNEYDLNDFSIDCSLGGAAMTSSKVILACRAQEDALEVHFAPVSLAGAAADMVVRGSELDGSDLATLLRPWRYSSAEYALVDEADDCSSATYSPTVPNDGGLGASGVYKVCVKLREVGAGSDTFESSVTFRYSAASPVFTSIDLVGPSVDGVHLDEYLGTPADLVGNLNASNYNQARYTLAKNSFTCDGGLVYFDSIPQTSSQFFEEEGLYKVCVAVTNEVGEVAYGSSSTFEFYTDYVTAELSGLPREISSQNNLNITVSGAGVDQYSYKVGVSGSTSCSDPTGYSSSVAVANPIAADITALSGELKLCVLGEDSIDGKNQLLTSATSYTWVKDNFEIGSYDFKLDDVSSLWFDVHIANWDTPVIFAQDLKGQMFRSDDRGTSWDFMCKIPFYLDSKMTSSPKKYGGAFVASGDDLYRIEQNYSYACPRVSAPLTRVNSTYNHVPVAFNSKGLMYVIDETSSTSSRILSSSDRGETWNLEASLPLAGNQYTISIDPNNDDNFLFSYMNESGDLVWSKDGLTSIGQVPGNEVSPAPPIDDFQVQSIDFHWDTGAIGRVYTNNGLLSNNYGRSWQENTTDLISDGSRWAQESSRRVYRLRTSGSDTFVETAGSLPSASFTAEATLSNVTAPVDRRTISVSSDGSLVTALVGMKLFIKDTTGSSTYDLVPYPDTKQIISSITSGDEQVAYAVDYDWNYLKTSNSGTAWSKVHQSTSSCVDKVPRVKTSPSDSNFVFSWPDNDGGTNCTKTVRSTDGMTSVSEATNGMNTGSPIIALNPSDSTELAIIGNSTFRRSIDSGANFSDDSLNSINTGSHSTDGFLSDFLDRVGWYVSGGELIEVDGIGGTKSLITGNLTFSNPAGLEVTPSGDFRVISSTGVVDQGSEGAGFGTLSATGGLNSCSRRIFRSLSTDDSNVWASGCYKSSEVSYTLNGGVNWVDIDLSSFSPTANCTINDIEIIGSTGNEKLIIACEDIDALEVLME